MSRYTHEDRLLQCDAPHFSCIGPVLKMSVCGYLTFLPATKDWQQWVFNVRNVSRCSSTTQMVPLVTLLIKCTLLTLSHLSCKQNTRVCHVVAIVWLVLIYCEYVRTAISVWRLFPGPSVSACPEVPLQQAGKQGFEFHWRESPLADSHEWS